MKLKEIHLKNFRCYEDITVPLDERLTVLVAPNGQGKTTILDAMVILLEIYVKRLQSNRIRLYIETHNIRSIPDEKQKATSSSIPMKQMLPCVISVKSIHYDWRGYPVISNWYLELKTTDDRRLPINDKIEQLFSYIDDLVDIDKNNSEVSINLPLIAFYSVNRGLKYNESLLEKIADYKFSNENTRYSAYNNCLEEYLNYDNAFDWFIDLYDKLKAEAFERLELGETVNMKNLSSEFTLVIQEVVDIVLRNVGWGRIKTQTQTQTHSRYSEILLTHKDFGSLFWWQLSEGIRSVLGMVMDMAYRCCILNSHLGKDAVKETEGIVLIDEVDMHLHPEWQQTILADLQKAFPKIQFIVTTHSPQVLTTVPSKCIRMIDRQSISYVPAGSEGAKSSRLLNQIFNVKSRPPHNEVTKWLIKYRELVYSDKWDSTEALELRHQLDEAFQGNEPELTELDLYIDNRKWELSLEENQ